MAFNCSGCWDGIAQKCPNLLARRLATSKVHSVEPEFYYVRDKSSRAAHHWDYFNDSSTKALCGHPYMGEIRYEGAERPKSVCRDCQSVVPIYLAKYWKLQANSLDRKRNAMEARLRVAYDDLVSAKQRLDEYDNIIVNLNGNPAPPYYFVRDNSSESAHHWSYIDDAKYVALCGHRYSGEIVYEGSRRPQRVCVRCVAALPTYHAFWWRKAARAAEKSRRKFQQRADVKASDLRKLHARYEELLKKYDAQVALSDEQTVGKNDNELPNALRDPLWDLLDD